MKTIFSGHSKSSRITGNVHIRKEPCARGRDVKSQRLGLKLNPRELYLPVSVEISKVCMLEFIGHQIFLPVYDCLNTSCH